MLKKGWVCIECVRLAATQPDRDAAALKEYESGNKAADEDDDEEEVAAPARSDDDDDGNDDDVDGDDDDDALDKKKRKTSIGEGAMQVDVSSSKAEQARRATNKRLRD
jgi:hypothetical protein